MTAANAAPKPPTGAAPKQKDYKRTTAPRYAHSGAATTATPPRSPAPRRASPTSRPYALSIMLGPKRFFEQPNEVADVVAEPIYALPDHEEREQPEDAEQDDHGV